MYKVIQSTSYIVGGDNKHTFFLIPKKSTLRTILIKYKTDPEFLLY